jgi:hypothetical protein
MTARKLGATNEQEVPAPHMPQAIEGGAAQRLAPVIAQTSTPRQTGSDSLADKLPWTVWQSSMAAPHWMTGGSAAPRQVASFPSPMERFLSQFRSNLGQIGRGLGSEEEKVMGEYRANSVRN